MGIVKLETRPSVPLVLEDPNELPFETVIKPYIALLVPMLAIAGWADAKKRFLKLFGREPKHNFILGDGISPGGAHVRDTATSYDAIESIYMHRNQARTERMTFKQLTSLYADRVWMNIRNAQALRNRKLIATLELKRTIASYAIMGEEVRIFSLACGSARAVIEAVAEMQPYAHIRVLLVDRSENALAYARKLALEYNVSDIVITKKGNVLRFEREVGDFDPNICEMVGFIDYWKDGLVIELLKRIREHLGAYGTLLTCQIHPNSEQYFLEQIVNWKMVYRTIDRFNEMLEEAGYDVRIVTEPHKIHSVAVATVS